MIYLELARLIFFIAKEFDTVFVLISPIVDLGKFDGLTICIVNESFHIQDGVQKADVELPGNLVVRRSGLKCLVDLSDCEVKSVFDDVEHGSVNDVVLGYFFGKVRRKKIHRVEIGRALFHSDTPYSRDAALIQGAEERLDVGRGHHLIDGEQKALSISRDVLPDDSS